MSSLSKRDILRCADDSRKEFGNLSEWTWSNRKVITSTKEKRKRLEMTRLKVKTIVTIRISLTRLRKTQKCDKISTCIR